jgi:hypothetical protein
VIDVGDDSQDPHLYETAEVESGTYAALSYCWGRTRTFTTTQATLQARKDGFFLSDLPKTCRDAVVIARAIGLRYIWIDSLCIIQDSNEDWEKEAALMGDVYSNAVITLAALDSPDSDTGLFISDATRQTFYLTSDVGDGNFGYVYARKGFRKLMMGFLHADRSPPLGDDFGGILQTRGWTLQELTLSPRVLWFSAWELGWSCRTRTACECDPIPTSQLMKRSAARLTTMQQEGEPTIGLEMWRDFVKVFTGRKLTHETDRLPALTGIATAMSKHISGRYFAGLWEHQLDENLLWTASQPDLYAATDQDTIMPDGYAPTWSWARAAGPIWFVNYTGSPVFQDLWHIRGVEFKPATSNRFGPGQGTITMEAFVLPLNISDDAYFVCPVVDEYVHLSDTAQSWFPDRAGPQELDHLAEAELLFLFAGVQRKFRETSQEQVTKFVGLVVKKATEDVYERVGLIDAAFNTDSCDGSWSDWKCRGHKQCVTLA